MREGWRSKPLGEVTTFLNGLWKGEKPPFVTVGVIRNTNFTADGSIDDSDIAWLEVEQKKFEKRQLKFGDIILEKSGGGPKQPVGRVVLFEKRVGAYSFSNFTSAIRINNQQQLDCRFLQKFLFWQYASGVTGSMQSHSTGIRNLNTDAYKNIDVPLPPLADQQRIVDTLDQALAGLATAGTNAEKNLKNAHELFDSCLNSECTAADNDSVEKPLGEVCDLYQGLAINKGTKHLLVAKSSLPLLRIRDLRDGSHEQYVAEVGFPKNARVNPEDLIYTRTGQIGLVFRGRDGVLHNNCFKVSPRPEIVPGYLFWWLQNPYFRAKITVLAARMAQPDITHTIFKAQQIRVPPIRSQLRAVERLEALHADTQKLASIFNTKLERLSELKQSLLEKAFAGDLTPTPSSAIKEAAE